ncbi:MAG: hypothetical protein M3419_03090 [Actinomycetota bacterium]|nr:hypothetical protein [Actinomycetota bacterium]
MASSPGHRTRVGLAAATAVVVLSAGGYVALRHGPDILGSEDACEVQVDGETTTLEPDQASNAALISAIAVRRGLPKDAATVALATAFQESKIRNLDYGDRDSLGIFQQRPSQGWGTERQVSDPYYSTGAFYDALGDVDGYLDLPVHVAAQEVQRSADGGAYEQHEERAHIIATALTGRAEAALTCEVTDPTDSGQDIGEDGLTRNARAVRADVRRAFGELPDGGFAPGGVSTGHAEGSAHYDGRAVDFFFRPIRPAQTRDGWALAQYLVARAAALEIRTVIFDERIWTARRSAEGWRAYEVSSSSGDQDILLHRDHVHVDVA